VLRKAEDSPSIYAQLGRVIRHVQDEARMNLDQFADALGKDKRQVARWMDGSERPQIEAVFAVEAFRSLLAVGFAREAQSVDVVTVISVRRLA
jgi:transcriptional regulator with XRE-family HTH domain